MTSASPRIVARISFAIMALMLCLSLSACVGVVTGVGAAAVAAGTTEKGFGTSISDNVIKAKITDALFSHDINLFTSITVSVNDGSVLLTGNVKASDDKIQATRIAWQSRGVLEVINELEVKDISIKQYAKDLTAAAEIRGKLIADQNISSINFSIDVVDGTVFLTGIAASEDEMSKVIDHARSLRFATDVKNYIRINDDDR